MNKEVAREIITTYLSKSMTTDGVAELFKIRFGDDNDLLKHINALIDIFTKAKEEIEGDKNNHEQNMQLQL